MRQWRGAVLAAAAWAASHGGAAAANERHLTYTYESAVLPPAAREIEVWNTLRLGRDGYYSEIDQRVEFEVGVTDRLMTSLYLNVSTIAQPTAAGAVQIASELGSLSSEWKYKLLDPVADPLGLSLYLELTGATDEFELEGKVILDKRVGPWLLAANLVAEQEWEFGVSEVAPALTLEADAGFAYFVTDRVSIGIEARNHNLIEGGFEHSALFAGPVVAYADRNWWVALTVMPQLPALVRSEPASPLVLDELEKFNARLLFSFHL